MDLYSLHTGFFKLDGGAMFGVVPKALWQKQVSADSNNLCTWAMRCLVIKDNARLILIDTGIGDKQSEKFFSHYYLSETQSITEGLKLLGFSVNQVTDVFFTHLHFDHSGGAIKFNKNTEKYELVCPNANHWVHSKQWEWAVNPNNRERASFLKENILPIKSSGRLKFVDKEAFNLFEYIEVNGHTQSQLLPKIRYKNKTLVYVADLLPSTAHLPLPYVMGYDVRPLETLKEKKEFLELAVKNKYVLFFEHDYEHECAELKFSDKGFPILSKTFSLKEL